MHIFLNIFLGVYLADGTLSVADNLLKAFADLHWLMLPREIVAIVTLIYAIPVYIAMGIDTRIPKRIFLPLILYAFWCLFALQPLPLFMDIRTLMHAASWGQMALGIAAILWIRSASGKYWFFPRAFFDGPVFRVANTLIYGGVNLVFIPTTLIAILLFSLPAWVEQASGGFISLKSDGLYFAEKTYMQDHKTIQLTAMVHIGEQDYYDDLTRSFSDGHSVILVEGVTDVTHRLKNRFGYGRIADAMSLMSQSDMALDGTPIDLDELEDPDAFEMDSEGPSLLWADVDLMEFDDQTIAFLDALGSFLGESDSLAEGFQAYNQWVKKNMTPEMMEVITFDIFTRRNDQLITRLDAASPVFDQILIPWGAMHMPAIEQEVIARGYTLTGSHMRKSIDFSRLSMNRIKEALTRKTPLPPQPDTHLPTEDRPPEEI